MYLEFGAIVVPLLVVPILIARRTFASYLELKASQEQTIETLILALEAKDPYTSGHARRVAMFSGTSVKNSGLVLAGWSDFATRP